MSYPDQSHSTTFTSASSSPAASSNVIENVLHSFVAERAARFDKKKVKCFKAQELVTLLGMYRKQLEFLSKVLFIHKLRSRMSQKNQKALLSVDFNVNTGCLLVDATCDVVMIVSNAADEFSSWGIFFQAKLEKLNDKVKLEESNARFDKWKDSSKNLDKLINSSMSSRSKFGLGFGDTFGSDEVFDLSAPSIFDSSPKDVAEKPLYDRFVKAVGMNAVPPPITGTFMPPSNTPDLDDTQVTYGSKSNNYFETNSVSNDFVSCDNSDKSSDSETTDFASCVSSVKSSRKPHKNRDLGIVDSGCSRSMIGNKEKLDDFVKIVGEQKSFSQIKSVIVFSRSSNYLRIVRWFSEFQEGTISTASICLTSNLKEMSPVCWPKHP
ncbi:hypothetical protein Tco_1417419 [Tanacetum coccineum]